METLVSTFFAGLFLVIGISHAAHPEKWVKFFHSLRQLDYGALVVIMYTLPAGLIICLLHNKWELAPSLFITVAGWIMTLKCAVYALHDQGFYKLVRQPAKLQRNLRLTGIVMALLSLSVLGEVLGYLPAAATSWVWSAGLH
ncbi:hypothetical protein BH24BAC1_BH24BAC1_12090 [soil metagenome]